MEANKPVRISSDSMVFSTNLVFEKMVQFASTHLDDEAQNAILENSQRLSKMSPDQQTSFYNQTMIDNERMILSGKKPADEVDILEIFATSKSKSSGLK